VLKRQFGALREVNVLIINLYSSFVLVDVFVTRKSAKIYLLASACVYTFHISRNAERIFMQFVLRSFTKFFDPFLCSTSSVVKFSSFEGFALQFPCNLM
jgi:hypothetical protein